MVAMGSDCTEVETRFAAGGLLLLIRCSKQGTVHEPPGLETEIWLHVGEAVRSALNGDPKRGKKGSGPPPVTTTSLAGRERLGVVGVKMYVLCRGDACLAGRAGA